MKQPCEDNILGDEVQNGPIRRKGEKPVRFFFIQRTFSFQALGVESGFIKKWKEKKEKKIK